MLAVTRSRWARTGLEMSCSMVPVSHSRLCERRQNAGHDHHHHGYEPGDDEVRAVEIGLYQTRILGCDGREAPGGDRAAPPQRSGRTLAAACLSGRSVPLLERRRCRPWAIRAVLLFPRRADLDRGPAPGQSRAKPDGRRRRRSPGLIGSFSTPAAVEGELQIEIGARLELGRELPAESGPSGPDP